MKIPLRYDLARCAAREHYKFAIDHICVRQDGERAVAVATDGREMVEVPVTLEPDDKLGNYPVAAFRDARDAGVRALDEAIEGRPDYEFRPALALALKDDSEAATIALEGDGAASTDSASWQSKTCNREFPTLTERRPTGAPLARIAIDPTRLLNIALALGCGDGVANGGAAVVIEIHGGHDTPLVVRPLAPAGGPADSAVGFLMPVSGGAS